MQHNRSIMSVFVLTINGPDLLVMILTMMTTTTMKSCDCYCIYFGVHADVDNHDYDCDNADNNAE